jgi:hypothetical protein
MSDGETQTGGTMERNKELISQLDEEDLVPAGQIDLTDEAIESQVSGGAPEKTCQIGSCHAWG